MRKVKDKLRALGKVCEPRIGTDPRFELKACPQLQITVGPNLLWEAELVMLCFYLGARSANFWGCTTLKTAKVLQNQSRAKVDQRRQITRNCHITVTHTCTCTYELIDSPLHSIAEQHREERS